MEHLRPDGIGQGYFCTRCGASGRDSWPDILHGPGKCESNPLLVEQLINLNMTPQGKVTGANPWPITPATGPVENALIDSVTIEIEDHGILTAWINLKWSSSACGFGGYAYDRAQRNGPIIPHANLAKFVRAAMTVIGVRRWDDLKRASCRIRLDPSGNRVVALGHFMEDRWLDIADLHKDTP